MIDLLLRVKFWVKICQNQERPSLCLTIEYEIGT